jgi:hypothetical protein
MKVIAPILVLLLLPLSAFPQRPPAFDNEAVRLSKIAVATRITEKITLDGYLNEAAWDLAPPITDFHQFRPNNGEPASERTEARILYDDYNLYVGFRCFDSDAASIVINDLKEDFNFMESDTANVIIDGLHDRRSAFNFNVNAGGGRRDMQISNDIQTNPDWDGVWDAKVSRNEEGWIAEFVIPFKTLRFSDSPTQEWGLNLGRRILRLNEEDHWSPNPIRRPGFAVSGAGTLKGLEGIRQGRNLKIKPFATAGLLQVRAADGRMQTIQSLSRFKDYDGGVDLKYSLTPSLTLDATYRTDFAQVEVDQQQVNLTRFNLFFPEKRDFFLENSGIFNFGSAGNQGNLVPFFSRRIGLSAAGTPIPIQGGARVTGSVRRFDVGFLAMKTDDTGLTPSSTFVVGRMKGNFRRNSWIGALWTSRDSTNPGDYNRVYGVDAHLQFRDRLEFDTYLLRSDTPGRSGRNQGRRFQTAWKDDELTLNAEYNEVAPNFNPEVGFVLRRDVAQYKGEFLWKPLLRGSDSIRNLNFGANLEYNEGSGSRQIETRTQELTAGIVFETNASINFSAEQTFDRLASPLRIPAGNPRATIQAGDYNYLTYTTTFTTDQRRKIAGNATIGVGDFYGGRRKSLVSGLILKPNYHLAVNLTYDRNDVRLPSQSFATNLAGVRVSYSFTPRAFLNAFIQYNADTHQISSNIRFNLIHRPLSDLYLVYNDRRDSITGEPLERAFIVKFTNLFNF